MENRWKFLSLIKRLLPKTCTNTLVYILENKWHRAIQMRNEKRMHVTDILNITTEVLSRDIRQEIKIRSMKMETKDKNC